MSEKTEQPTAQKLREARKQGQMAKSRLLSSAAVTFGALMGLTAFADGIAARLMAYAQKLFTQPVAPAAALSEGLSLLAVTVAPALLGALAGALVSAIPPAGLQLNTQTVSPQLERVNPLSGFKRLFSLKQLMELLRGLVVAAVMGCIVWNAVEGGAPLLTTAVQRDGVSAFHAVLQVLAPAVRTGSVVLLTLGAVDYLLARRRHLKELMMSRDEVKREHKSSEGDPHHKAKRKQLHAQMAMGGSARGVHKATAVVVNPTHIAVALRYDESESDAPYIVAKGREEDALSIRREAQTLDIPIVRDIPLARALVHYDVGEEVPEELYQAAAAVLKVALERKQSALANDGSLVKETP